MKAAVIGCGRMGAEPSRRLEGSVPAGWLPISHAEAFQRTEGVNLVGLADIDGDRLGRHAAAYDVPFAETDYRVLLERCRPELVSIATRTPQKLAIIQAACEYGARGLYVEKPLANSVEDCLRALEVARRAGVTLILGVNRRYHGMYRRARSLIESGAIGEVLDVEVAFGRGQLLWTHPHGVDLIVYLTGATSCVEVFARLEDDTVAFDGVRTIDSDPIVSQARFLMNDGRVGGIGRFGGCSVRVGGREGTLTVHGDGSHLQLERPRAGTKGYFAQQVFEYGAADRGATVTALTELVAAVKGVGPVPMTPEEILLGQKMLLGCAWSHVSGRSVVMGDVPRDLVLSGRTGQLYA